MHVINMILISLRVRFTITANRLIHFLRRVPLIKKAVPSSLYGNYSLKTVFTVFGVLFTAFKKILFRLFYIVFLAALGITLYQASMEGGFSSLINSLLDDSSPLAEFTAQGAVNYILSVWFILSFVGGFTGARIISTSNHNNDDTLINYLRANPAAYAKSQILLARVIDLFLYFPYLLIAFFIAGMPLWKILIMLIIFTSFRLLGEFFNLLIYRLIGKHFGKPPLSLSSILILLAAVVIPVRLGVPDWGMLLQNPLVFAGAVAAGIAAGIYIVRYTKYSSLLRERISATVIALDTAKKKGGSRYGVNLQDVKKWSKDLKQEDLQLNKYDNKTGFAYLNAIFFDRHSKFFKKKVLFRVRFILAAGLLVSLFAVICMIVTGLPLVSSFQDSTEVSSIFNSAPVFFFVIYIASMGRVVTAGVFSNCDIQMLHYPYYRTKETIFASFKARFAFILRKNFLITTIMSATVIVSIGLLSWNFDYFRSGLFFILLTCIGIFFAFNDLFLYYVIQPYDSAGQTKSIAYLVINGIVYLIAYTSLQSSFSFYTYSIIIIIAATILYLGVGTGMLLLFAPKNFKLR